MQTDRWSLHEYFNKQRQLVKPFGIRLRQCDVDYIKSLNYPVRTTVREVLVYWMRLCRFCDPPSLSKAECSGYVCTSLRGCSPELQGLFRVNNGAKIAAVLQLWKLGRLPVTFSASHRKQAAHLNRHVRGIFLGLGPCPW